LQSVPTIEEIAHDPSRVRGLSAGTIAALMARTAAVQGTLSAALILSAPGGSEQPAAATHSDDRMLTPDEAATLLRKKRQWIYRNAHTLPFVKRVSRKSLLCSEAGIKRWLAVRKA